MKFAFGLTLFLSISISCSVVKNRPSVDIGSNFYIDHECRKNQRVDVYRSSINNKKLKGNTIRKTVVYLDDTLYFIHLAKFENGVLNGIDSTFMNGHLLSVKNYREGILQGEQMEFQGSVKTISYYQNGVIQDYQSTYINGNLFKKTFYNQGIKDSLEYYYDNLGNIVTTTRYNYYQQENWRADLDLDNFKLISIDSPDDTLSVKVLDMAKYDGTIVYNSYDPKGFSDARNWTILHESLIQNSLCVEDDLFNRGYFYIIDENDCIICDYIDRDGIWVAFIGAFDSQIAFFELTKK